MMSFESSHEEKLDIQILYIGRYLFADQANNSPSFSDSLQSFLHDTGTRSLSMGNCRLECSSVSWASTFLQCRKPEIEGLHPSIPPGINFYTLRLEASHQAFPCKRYNLSLSFL